MCPQLPSGTLSEEEPQEGSCDYPGPQFPGSVVEEQSSRAVKDLASLLHVRESALSFSPWSVPTFTLSKTFSLVANVQTLKMSQN